MTITETATAVAEFVREEDGWSSKHRLYRVTPAMNGHDYVMVNAHSGLHFAAETLVQAATSAGYPDDGTTTFHRRAGLDHEAALADLGYTIVGSDRMNPHAQIDQLAKRLTAAGFTGVEAERIARVFRSAVDGCDTAAPAYAALGIPAPVRGI